jgi:hypothetical protein
MHLSNHKLCVLVQPVGAFYLPPVIAHVAQHACALVAATAELQ